MVRVQTGRRRAPVGRGLPGVRVPNAGNAAGALAVGQGIDRTADALITYSIARDQEEERIRAEQQARDDRVAAQGALNQIQQARLQDFTNPEGGFDHLKGNALISASDGAYEAFERSTRDLLHGLSPDQRILAQAAADEELLIYRDRLNGQVGLARHSVAQKTFDDALALTRDSAVDAVGLYPGAKIGERFFGRVRATVDAYAADQADSLEVDPEVWRERRYRDEASRGGRQIVERLIGLGELDQAREFVEQHGQEFNPGDGTALMQQVRTAAQADTIQRTAGALYQPQELAGLTTVAGQMREGASTPERYISDQVGAYRESLKAEGVESALVGPAVAAFEQRMQSDLRREREAQMSEFARLQDSVLSGREDGLAVLSDPAALVGRFSQAQIDELSRNVRMQHDEEASQRAMNGLQAELYSENPGVRSAARAQDLYLRRSEFGDRWPEAVKLWEDSRERAYDMRGGGTDDERRVKLALQEMGVETGAKASSEDAQRERAFRDAVASGVLEWESAHNGQRIGSREHGELIDRLKTDEVMLTGGVGAVDLGGQRFYLSSWRDVDLANMRQIAPDAVKAALWGLHDADMDMNQENLQRALWKWLEGGQQPVPNMATLPDSPPGAPGDLVNPSSDDSGFFDRPSTKPEFDFLGNLDFP